MTDTELLDSLEHLAKYARKPNDGPTGFLVSCNGNVYTGRLNEFNKYPDLRTAILAALEEDLGFYAEMDS
jgi:hypothetical protein